MPDTDNDKVQDSLAGEKLADAFYKVPLGTQGGGVSKISGYLYRIVI
jgi:hypothetical protein